MSALLEPMHLGDYQLANKVIMAPLTRCRAHENGAPSPLMAEYYAQRASAGLLIAEATAVSKQGYGWVNSPGLFTDEQQAGWQAVAEAVHKKNGKIFLQLWHMGSTVHPDFLDGELPVSSSAVKQQGSLTTPKGRDREFVVPQAMTKQQIADVVQQFADAASRAIAAGLDGVELHAANGFLIDQFTRDALNQRDDEYGGSIDNRLRFMTEVVDAVTKAIGSGKVGIRLSPTNGVWGISDSNPLATFTRAIEKLNAFNLAYVHILEPKPNSGHPMETIDYITPILREKYQGTFLINGGFDQESGEEALDQKVGDAIVYGVPFIANPDLVSRFTRQVPLAEPDPTTFYSPGEKGYTDYATLELA